MAQQLPQAIFRGIDDNDLEAVQQRVLANGAVLEGRESFNWMTPLIYALYHSKPNIAHHHRTPGPA